MGGFSNNASVNWNRSNSMTRNYFTGTAQNPAVIAGINEPAQTTINGLRPNFYNGLPNLNFTNFTSLNNTSAQNSINQTISFSDFVSYRHKKNNYRAGFRFAARASGFAWRQQSAGLAYVHGSEPARPGWVGVGGTDFRLRRTSCLGCRSRHASRRA